ncbi:Crp/Fnr family transcriptional regulator [Candidatus Magnetomorum sp. HK-1]|nr:Crp/Fnr family transcriptional regulator [Candidatus Magnetomorum sp. HK-1]
MSSIQNNSFQTREFRKGHIIIKEGQESKESYIIRKGYVTIYKVTNSQKIIIDQLGPGEIFGEMGALAGSKRSANAVTLEPTEVIVVQKKVLSEALKKSPPLISSITNLLIKRLNKTDKILFDGQEQNAPADIDISYSYPKICSILEIICLTHPDSSDSPLKIPLLVLSSKIQKIIIISKIEIDQIFKKLNELNMAEIIQEGYDKFLIIKDKSKFLAASLS